MASPSAVPGGRAHACGKSTIATCAFLALAGCAHPRPNQPSPVAVPAHVMRASDHPAFLEASTSMAAARLAAQRYDMRGTPLPAQCASAPLAGHGAPVSGPLRYLVLSGGSQNGAFGAGFFLGLSESGLLPAEPTVVTGVSTGALQSTFLFLARQPVPGDRSYDWVGGIATTPGGPADRPALVPGRSNIEDLALAYSIERESRILQPFTGGGVGMLVKGAKGTLSPLRKRLLALVSPETIRLVAMEACRGRKLFVGAADVDDGQAYAFDMTALALMAYDGAASATRMDFVRRSYVEALLASSSVPVGALPVTLRIRDMDAQVHRRHLFVDGGARFGVFLEDIAQAKMGEDDPAAQHEGVTLIVNTRLTTGVWRQTDDPLDPQSKWTLPSLGLRTVDMLENQVYRLSVEAVEYRAAQLGGLHMAFISRENVGQADPDTHAFRGKACIVWKSDDETRLKPIEFHPNYMACLIDYGRARGRAGQWNLVK